jgi:homoisocitrate dehydrogenase
VIDILVIPGDGIGPEVVAAALAVMQATAAPLRFHEAAAGWEAFRRAGDALPADTLAAARSASAILFGAVASPSAPVAGYRSPIVALRQQLGLGANLRPVRSANADLVVVRENTEGLYAGRERVSDDGATAIAERVITRQASAHIAHVAFRLARQRSRPQPRVTIVHKANILRATCGLFRQTALQVAADYPDVRVDELLVDTAALQLVAHPARFDVLVTTNLFGDILSDVACHHAGGLGMARSANLGAHHALFEPVHGAAPDIAGRGRANPLAAIGCAAWMLEHLAQQHAAAPALATAARQIERALAWVREHGPLTPDLGGTATTGAVTAAVIAALGTAAQEVAR